MTQDKVKLNRIALLLLAASACAPALVMAGDSPGGLTGMAEREILRRMARMEDARQAIEKGDQSYAQGDYEAALGYYKAALDSLPEAQMTAEWRAIAQAKVADASVELAKERAANGRYKEANELVDGALAAVPGHKAATILKKRLGDPDRYPPALTPDHVAAVEKVTRELQMGASARDLGQLDNAIDHYEDALRVDGYNVAARRGMEAVEQDKSVYYNSAYDHTRIRMLNEVAKAWETSVPVAVQAPGGISGPVSVDGSKYLSEKMKRLIVPQVQFSGATIEEALEYLRIKSRDLDDIESDPSKKGVNIILRQGDAPSTAAITLDLKDVPLEEALRYVTELAGMKVKVEPFAVLVVPTTEDVTNQYTRIFRVRPDFLSLGGDAGGGGGAAPAPVDPFAPAGAAAGGSSLIKRKTAKEILMEQGVVFPEGASAVFSASTSQLIVKNTAPNLDLVEAYVESIGKDTPKQIFITAKFVEVSQKNTDELGFDWLLGAFNIPGSERAFGSGGNVGNSGNGPLQNSSGATTDFPMLFPGGGPVGQFPLSRGNRSGNAAISLDSVDGQLEGASAAAGTAVAPGAFAFSGVLTDPQFQVVIRALNQRKGVDLMSAPSVTTKAGTRAIIEVIREFWYPTEFDPPEIPQQFGGNVGVSGSGISGSSSTFPVTPTTPTTFEMKPIGVRMEVDPVVGADGYTIDLNLSPEVNEFEGFINYGSPIQTGSTDALGNPIQITLTENRIPQPVFSTRKVTTSVTVWDGQTVALGGLIREDVQDVEDRIPILGDIPIIGRLFQTKAEDHFKRNLTIFVTAVLIDPSGQRVNANKTGAEAVGSPDAGLAPVGAGNGLFPGAGQ
jgi:general secretion pathway protein D